LPRVELAVGNRSDAALAATTAPLHFPALLWSRVGSGHGYLFHFAGAAPRLGGVGRDRQKTLPGTRSGWAFMLSAQGPAPPSERMRAM